MAKKPSPRSAKSAPSVPNPAKTRKTAGTLSIAAEEKASWGGWVLLGLSALGFLITRIQLLSIPFERDEGGFAYIGHWLLKGKHLYTDMIDSKLPGLYLYYGGFMSVFGYGPTGAHIGLLVANIVTAVCFYFFIREAFNKLVAAVACSFYLWLTISPNVVGFAAHATQLFMPFIMGGVLLFWKGLKGKSMYHFFLSGLLIGLAFTIKQQSAIFGILLAILWWPARMRWMKRSDERIAVMEWILLGVGGLLPALGVLAYFMAHGQLETFLDWTVQQPISLAAAYKDPWYVMFMRFIPSLIHQYEVVWMLAAAGMVFIFLSGFNKLSVFTGLFLALLGLGSVFIGTAYYKHYFIPALPGVALLAAVTLNWGSRKIGALGQPVVLGCAALLIMFSLRGKSYYYFEPDFYKIHFEQYTQNMFPEMERIGKELAKRVPEGEPIGIMGSEPEILVAANRESCTKHLMTYSMLIDPVNSPPLQKEYMRELTTCAPEYVVWATGSGSWAPGYEELAFVKGLLEWLKERYDVMGMAESRDDRPGVIHWDDELKGYDRQNDFVVFVFKKKPPEAETLQ